jgi:hypothetical protein
MAKIGGREINDWLIIMVAMGLGLILSGFLVYILPAMLR